MQRLPVRVCVGQRFCEFHEPEAHRTGCHRAPERKPACLLHGVLRLADYQAVRVWQGLGGRVPDVAAYPSHTTASTAAMFAAMPQQKRTGNTANPLTRPSKTQGG